MRALLTNFGSLGDFRPLLILARHLLKAKMTPVLAFPPFAKGLAEQTGFQYYPLGPDLVELRDLVNAHWSEQPEVAESAEDMLALLRPFSEAFDRIFAELCEVARDVDVLISGPVLPLGRIVHEVTGVPFVSVQMCHFGGTGYGAIQKAGQELLNPFRRKLGLAPVSDPLTAGANSPQLALYAISAHLFTRPVDWPAHYHVTGFFFDDAGPAWCPPVELERFLAAGDAPVIITLGSMVHKDAQELAEIFMEATLIAQCRAIVQGLPPPSMAGCQSDEIYWTKFVPHEWLFPKASSVVLHGGAGTAANVFRFGVPGVFVPHGDCYDQRYWAQFALEAGCTVPAVSYHELTPTALGAAIRRVRDDDKIRRAATSLSRKVNSEPGARLAARLIKEMVAKVGLCQDAIF